MIKPVRLQLSRKKDFSLQALSLATNGLPAVNVARPSRHGNPFRIGRWFRIGERHSAGLTMAYSECLSSDAQHRRGYTLIETSAEAVDWFRRYLERYPLSRAVVDELRGKNLACFCGLGEPCHGDLLLEFANRPICEAAPMRLADAAAMFGLTAGALRTEARRGRLVISRVAGKDWVTKAEIERMFERCQLAPKAPDYGSGPPEPRMAAMNEPPGSSATESISRARDALSMTIERLKGGSPAISPPRTPHRGGNVTSLKSR